MDVPAGTPELYRTFAKWMALSGKRSVSARACFQSVHPLSGGLQVFNFWDLGR